ncbi:hypothetical protein HMI54_013323 [Coelomomyces lativittatus]|nr:hypothetical protein HMI54_013323 [Coelomomyces lativittatus]KAJ1518393.1 hypothetical protein HMI55_004698 [Coelomomyces lativittatus]
MHFVRTWTWTFTLLLGFVTLKSLHSSFFFSKKEDPNSPYGRPNVAAPSSSQAKEKKSSSPFKNNPKFLIDGPKRYEFLYSVKYPFQFHTKGISLVPGYTLMESTTVTTSNSELFLLPPDSIKGALQSEWPFLGKDLQVDLTLKYGTFTSNPGPTTTKVSSSLPLIHEYGMAFWWSTHRFNTSTSSTSNHLAMDISAFQGVVISILPISTTTTSSSTTKTIRSSSEEVKPSQGQDSEVKILVQVTSNLLSASYPKTSETLVTLGECVTPFRNLLPHSTLRMVYNHGLLVVETQWNALSRPCMSEHVDFIDLPSYFTLSAQNHQSARSTTLQLIDLAVYTLNPPSKKKPTPKPSYVKPPPSSSSSSSSSTKQVRNVDPNQPEVQTNSHIKEEAINNKQDTKHMEAMAEIKKSLDSITVLRFT